MKNPIIKYLAQNQFLSAFLVIAFLWFLIKIIYILIALFAAYIIMAAFSPLVRRMQKLKIPKAIAAMITYILILASIVMIVLPLLPFFMSQIQALFSNFPRYVDQAGKLIGITIEPLQVEKYLSSQIGTIGINAFRLTSAIFSSLFSVLTIFVISFYLLLDYEQCSKLVAGLFPKESRTKVITTLSQIERKLGAWFRGQLILSFAIGITTWTVLTLLGVPFALPLAILAGILEIVPTVGPILSAIPAVIIGIATSPALTIGVILAYCVIQLLENNVLVPKVMQQAVGLNPIVIITGVMIGGNLLGILGALLSIPFISILVILYNSLQNNSS